jgi:hypothetical protein
MWRRGTNPEKDSGTKKRNKVTFVVCGGVEPILKMIQELKREIK